MNLNRHNFKNDRCSATAIGKDPLIVKLNNDGAETLGTREETERAFAWQNPQW
jgi:hypothetical protein